MTATEVSSLYTGRYHRAFLDGIAGPGKYTVRSIDLRTLKSMSGMITAYGFLEDPDLSLAYMSDTKLTMVWLHDYPGWLAFCEPLGISIINSAKISKRLTVMTRLAYLSGFFGLDQLAIAEVTPDAFTAYDRTEVCTALGVSDSAYEAMAERFLDGANVISTELLETLITNGSEHVSMTSGISNPWEKQVINRSIDRAGSFSIRITTPEGTIKGDAFAMPRAAMGGYDVLYCGINRKPEVCTSKFVFVLAEPHPGVRHEDVVGQVAPPPVWSDDQTTSWLGSWLYPKEQLVAALGDYATRIHNDLSSGKFPKFFTDTSKRTETHSTIANFQEQAIIWHDQGLGLSQSLFLLDRIAQGGINKLAPTERTDTNGNLSVKRRFPVPCAMYVHVATDSWLHMAGFYDPETGTHPWPGEDPITPRGSVWFHERTGRLIYNDLDFAILYSRHGGWDLDDSVRAHARTQPDGRKVWVIVRSPNSYGEYDIKNYIEGTYAPTWPRGDGSMLSFPPVDFKSVPYLEEMDITYTTDSLTPPVTIEPDYTIAGVMRSVALAERFDGLLGRRLNADMAYYATVGDYRRTQLCAVESIVDACTQTQTVDAHVAIEADIETVVAEMIAINPRIDRKLWNDRIRRKPPRGVTLVDTEWTELWVAHDVRVDTHSAMLRQISQDAVSGIDIDLLDLGRYGQDAGQVFINMYYAEANRAVDVKDTAFYAEVNDRLVARLLLLDELDRHHTLLGAARVAYTLKRNGRYTDAALFSPYATPPKTSVFSLYLDALAFYGIGQDDWEGVMTCTRCGLRGITTDRMGFQRFHLAGATCDDGCGG